MADVTVIAVGGLREDYFRRAADEYKKRLSSSILEESYRVLPELKTVQVDLNTVSLVSCARNTQSVQA